MEFPLRQTKGHIIATIEGEDWLVDTGSPLSFGDIDLVLDGWKIQLLAECMGIGAKFLTEHTDIPLSGLIGTDILNSLDVVFDLPKGVSRLSPELAVHTGAEIPISLCMGVPVLSARINGEHMNCFFDTGAQVSYAPCCILRQVDQIGIFQDFYPTMGAFETILHWAELKLGNTLFRIRCGTMPDFMAGMMNISGATCIIGNEILQDHQIGYFPRQGVLVIE
ncbi:MAG: hypothetical protein WCY87_06085 [Candidatus Cloacimonadales bacterium]|nr:hypothetical protein [Candidatus Cloacimonadota bacterium]MCB5269274.1 hypothetical protein [Candidatus Cloacimonadota bacterium]MDD3299462.1 hypothetical protein [Bacteroidales bacterium]